MIDVTLVTSDFAMCQSLKMREIPPMAEAVPPSLSGTREIQKNTIAASLLTRFNRME